jgi:hypothetical protein
LSDYPLKPLQNPRSPGTSPLGLTSLKRKNLPIVVTLGGIGSCYASLAFYLIAFAPSYKLCDNRSLFGMKGLEKGLVFDVNLLDLECIRWHLARCEACMPSPILSRVL